MKAIYINYRGQFIPIKLRTFYEKRRIIFKYVASYMHKKMALQNEDSI